MTHNVFSETLNPTQSINQSWGKVCYPRLLYVADFLYQEAFLATYRTFIDPSLLIKKLLYRYSELSTSSDGQKRKLANNTFSLLVRVVNELW